MSISTPVLMDSQKAAKYLAATSGIRIMVIGDLMVDEFIWGKVNRISPEAPVPVVSVTKQSLAPGGAANVVNNIRSLGGQVKVAGVVGDDAMGEWLINALKKSGADPVAVLADKGRKTTLKTRVVAHSQQVVRIDREDLEPLSKGLKADLVQQIKNHIDDCDAIIIEDYSKGVIQEDVLDEIQTLTSDKKKLVLVDPKVFYPKQFRGMNILTPNHHEAGAFAGIPVTNEESLMKVGRQLLDVLTGSSLLITRGEEGMSLFEANGDITHIPTQAREVFDVSGAGDTVIATMACVMAAGGSMKEASILANYAAGIVVGKVGVATCSPQEIIRILEGRL